MTIFVSDSSCDMTAYPGVTFRSVPLTISSEAFSFVDDETLDVADLISTLRDFKGRSYTACPSMQAWLDAYEGGDEIYVTTLTGFLSGTYNSALVAKEMYLQDHPEAKIEVFDSRTTGPELRLITEKIIALKQAGLSFEEICKQTREYQNHTRLFFDFQSLHNFAQNGRVNKVVASAIGMLGINIIGTATEEGNIDPKHKVRGKKKILKTLVEELLFAGYEGGKVYICHINNLPMVHAIIEAVKVHFGTPDENFLFYPARGICTYYGEDQGVIIGCEVK